MRIPIQSRTLRLIAVGYAVKTLIVGIAWLFIPDLPARATSQVRQTWQRLAGQP